MTKNLVRRSGLIMPVVTRRFVENAWRRDCDFIILDLEDSVPMHLKDHARSLIREAIPVVAKGGAEVFVRINHDTIVEDLEGSVWPGLSRIRYPKAEHGAQIRLIDETITRLERERGIAPGTIEIEPNIETALGVRNVAEIVGASARITEFGAATAGYDMSRDLGVDMFVEFDQFMYFKGEAELAARALDLDLRGAPFVANVSGSVKDADHALREARAIFQCGFYFGGGGLNPAVVAGHNEGLTPTEEDISNSKRVLELYETMMASGRASMKDGDRIIDKYEANRARHLLEWARLCRERDHQKTHAVQAVTVASPLLNQENSRR